MRWRRVHGGVLLNALLSMACLACFLTMPRTSTEVAPPTVTWALIHQPSIKKLHCRLAYWSSLWGYFLNWAPLLQWPCLVASWHKTSQRGYHHFSCMFSTSSHLSGHGALCLCASDSTPLLCVVRLSATCPETLGQLIPLQSLLQTAAAPAWYCMQILSNLRNFLRGFYFLCVP